MHTDGFETHRALVVASSITTGEATVRIPGLLPAGEVVRLPTLGLTQTNGEWNVPSAGSSVFVAVSPDRDQFLWLTGVTVPTDSDIDFNDNVTIGGDLTVDGDLTIDTDTLHVDSTNNYVGIGTTSPDTTLTVNGNPSSGNEVVRLYRKHDGGWGGAGKGGYTSYYDGTDVRLGYVGYVGNDDLHVINEDADGKLLLGTNGNTDSLIINSSGNVGIGTTSPSVNLHVSSGISGDAELRIEADTDNNTEGDLPYLTFAADGGILEGVIGLNDNTMVFANSVTSSQGFDFRTGTSNYYTNGADVVAGTTSRLFIDSSGNVGIGDNTPSYKLEVNGTGAFMSNLRVHANGSAILTLRDTGATNTGGYVEYESSNGTTLGYIGYANNDDIYIANNQSGGYIYFRAGNATRAYFTNAGHFLPNSSNAYDLGSSSRRWQDVYAYTINLNSQNGSRLQMYGETHSFGVQNATTYARSSQVHAWYRGGSHNDNSLNAGTGGQYQAHLDYYGSIWINDRAFKPNAGSWESSSDARIKKNVVDYSGGLSVITSLRPVYYEWDAEGHMFPEGQHLGLIAQEVEEVYPRFVNTFTQDVTRVSDGEVITDSKTLSYTGEFNALMISAIKELSEQVTALTARIEVLEGG